MALLKRLRQADLCELKVSLIYIEQDLPQNFFFYNYLFYWGGQHMCNVCGDQRTTYQDQLPPSTMWVLGMELGSSNLAASTLSS